MEAGAMRDVDWVWVLFAESKGVSQPIAVFSSREKVDAYRAQIPGAQMAVMQMTFDPQITSRPI
jgi:hypothetical protein